MENKQCGKSQQRRVEYKCVLHAALHGEFVILTGAFVGGCKSASENIRTVFQLGFPSGYSWERRVFVHLQVRLGQRSKPSIKNLTEVVLILYWNTKNTHPLPIRNIPTGSYLVLLKVVYTGGATGFQSENKPKSSVCWSKENKSDSLLYT